MVCLAYTKQHEVTLEWVYIFLLEICVDDSINLILGEDDLTFYHGEFNDAFYYDKDQIKRGRVEYCVNQSYHGVCADEWSYEHASIVCKQLGFSRHGKYRTCIISALCT